MDIILRLFSLAGIFVSFGEGVWRKRARVSTSTPLSKKKNIAQIQVEQKPSEMLNLVAKHCNPTICGHVVLTRGAMGNTPDLEKEMVAKRLTEGLEVFDGHKLGLFR